MWKISLKNNLIAFEHFYKEHLWIFVFSAILKWELEKLWNTIKNDSHFKIITS